MKMVQSKKMYERSNAELYDSQDIPDPCVFTIDDYMKMNEIETFISTCKDKVEQKSKSGVYDNVVRALTTGISLSATICTAVKNIIFRKKKRGNGRS